MYTSGPSDSPLVIVGAGGFGRETLDAVQAAAEAAGRPSSVVFADDRPSSEAVRGYPVVRPQDAAGQWFVVGVADPPARRGLAGRMSSLGLVPRTIIHPQAVVGPETKVAPGCIILAGAHVSSSVTLGAHVQVNYNATVGHDAVLEDFVTVLPGANVGGQTRLGAGVTVGSNACILQGLRIGSGTVVGAGAVVVCDWPGSETLVGVPARPLRPK